ncbi:MAG TPA: UbiH/UbiF/VisC/COQ6 family ubiquinone biosynthesis hydroxylase [Hyphomicrobiales bacterium]|nr:UbiH/UbiF/VisC/COQ6 family ubiquinone biosynthesis hydroxylase [Hyphomicrobiales bacterium]
MHPTPDYDILIAGGGMAGLSMALALAGSGLRLALVDQQHPPSAVELGNDLAQRDFDTRVSALTAASAALLARLGVWESLQALRLSPYTRMHVWDADGTGAIDFDADDLHAEALGWIAENSLVTAVLADALAQTDAACRYDTGIVGLEHEREGYRLRLADGTAISARLVIGADGGRSRIREWAGLRTRHWSYDHQALVTTLRTELPHQATAWQRFMPTGPLAFLPLRQQGGDAQQYCSIVWSCEPALAAQLLGLDPAAFAQRCAQAFEWRLGAVEVLAPLQAFSLHQLHAVDYTAPHLALIGDAAHTIHPLAGQGVNLGLADVAALSEVILNAHAKGQDFASPQVLSRYQRQRKPANLGMMLGMEGFKRLFGSEDLLLRWLRNTGLRLTDGLTPLKQVLIRQAMGLR